MELEKKIEKLREDLINDVSIILARHSGYINTFTGLEKTKAKFQHLEEFDSFVEKLNTLVNELIDKHQINFSSQLEADAFGSWIKPLFDALYQEYMALAK
jgi:Flp pilus assembly CpaF family ATPase